MIVMQAPAQSMRLLKLSAMTAILLLAVPMINLIRNRTQLADDAENTGSTAVVYPGFVVVFIHFFTFLSADDIFITAIRCARLGRCVHSMKK